MSFKAFTHEVRYAHRDYFDSGDDDNNADEHTPENRQDSPRRDSKFKDAILKNFETLKGAFAGNENMERYLRSTNRTVSSGAPWGEDFYKILKERSRAGTGSKHKGGSATYNFSENASDKQLTPLEDEFFHACEYGDIPTVERILADSPNIDSTRTDMLGRTPLRLAVGNEHLEIVEKLLDRTVYPDMHEALLLSITLGHEEISETILKHPTFIHGCKKEKELEKQNSDSSTATKQKLKMTQSMRPEESQFSYDVTPLMLAAQYNRFEIVQLLLMRGERIPRPHHYYCACHACKEKSKMDTLRFRIRRLESYRALASEAYISLASRDPILTAFELRKELRQVAAMEKHFKNEYLDLATRLSDYTTKLLDRVRGSDELEHVLNKTGRSSKEKYATLARFKLAISYEEKKFVAHPFCQQKLVSIWYDDLRETLENNNWVFRILFVVALIFLYPFLAIVYLFAPNTKVGHFLRYPIIKLISSTVTYVIFLIMILVFTLTQHPAAGEKALYPAVYKNHFDFINRTGHANSSLQNFIIRTHRPDTVELLIFTWIIGMLWQECKQIYRDGIRGYFNSLYNILDTCMLLCYIASFITRYLSFTKTIDAIEYFQTSRPWSNLSHDELKEAFEKEYWLLADRFYWKSIDPFHVSEGLFAVANVLSFARISSLLPANASLGPTQISLGRMIADLARFMFIFLMMVLAFMVGLQNLYWYYGAKIRKSVDMIPHGATNAEKGFGDFELTFRTVFWAIFGLGESSVVQLNGFTAKFTESVGYILYGIYNFATVVVLLTMLIAMMSKSFEIIHMDSDIEWKFSRSKLFMEYIEDGSTLPVPLNLIPTPKSVMLLFRQAKHKYLKMRGKHEHWDPDVNQNGHGHSGADEVASDTIANKHAIGRAEESRESGPPEAQFIEMKTFSAEQDDQLTYSKVIRRIIKRYIFETGMDDGNEVTLDEIKQDISSFRFEVLSSFNQAPVFEDRPKKITEYDVLKRLQPHPSPMLGRAQISTANLEKKLDTLIDLQRQILEREVTSQDSRMRTEIHPDTTEVSTRPKTLRFKTEDQPETSSLEGEASTHNKDRKQSIMKRTKLEKLRDEAKVTGEQPETSSIEGEISTHNKDRKQSITTRKKLEKLRGEAKVTEEQLEDTKDDSEVYVNPHVSLLFDDDDDETTI